MSYIKTYDRDLGRQVRYTKDIFTPYARFKEVKGGYKQITIKIKHDLKPHIILLFYAHMDDAVLFLRDLFRNNPDPVKLRSYLNKLKTTSSYSNDTVKFPFAKEISRELLKDNDYIELCYFNNKEVSNEWDRLLLLIFNIKIETYRDQSDCVKQLEDLGYKTTVHSEKNKRMNTGELYYVLARK